MTEYRISLSSSGGLRLHVNGRRSLDLPPTEAAMRHLVTMLRHADSGDEQPRGYIHQFPTQAILDAWFRADAQRQRANAERETRDHAAALGIDLAALEISL